MTVVTIDSALYAKFYQSHGLDFTATHRTEDGRVYTSCTCGWGLVAVDAEAGVDEWLAHRHGALK